MMTSYSEIVATIAAEKFVRSYGELVGSDGVHKVDAMIISVCEEDPQRWIGAADVLRARLVDDFLRLRRSGRETDAETLLNEYSSHQGGSE